MPQFDFSNVFWPQIFWLAVFFAALYFGIVRLTLPRLGKVLDERAAKIDGDLDAARLAKDEADRITNEFNDELQRSREAAHDRIGAAKSEAAKAAEARLAEADAQAQAKIEAADQRIAAALAAAHTSLREVAVDNARAIVARITGKEADQSAVERAVDAAMAR